MKNASQPIWSHFAELRCRILWCLGIFLFFTFICYQFSDNFFHILVYPLEQIFISKGVARRLIYTQLTEAFVTYLKVAVFSGFVLSFPFIAIQTWLFVAPGLYKNEKKLFLWLIGLIPLFFLLGASFAYFYVLPKAYAFFLSFESQVGTVSLQLEAKMNEYLSLIMRVLFSFGLCFQLPLILGGAAWMGFVTKSTLIKNWRIALVIMSFISAIITPPDLLSMILLLLPLIILYTVAIIIVGFIERKKRKHA